MTARGIRGPIVALTGTPGVGKTSVADVLRAQGEAVLDIGRYKADARFDVGEDPLRPGTRILDEEALSDHLMEHLATELGVATPYDGPVFIDSHFAHHLLCVDRILVLRLSPALLRRRLEERGWSREKVLENVEAEALDLILQEAVQEKEAAHEAGETLDVGEVDTTGHAVEELAAKVRRLARTESTNLEIGTVDWSGEVLGWY